jgi:UDP-N-acetyl-D-glucosamine/UDP-N-acetyl-D-galactosamine dehydrogenase
MVGENRPEHKPEDMQQTHWASNPERIAVIGLGYVGLPVAVALAQQFPGTIGFDINRNKVAELQQGLDRTESFTTAELQAVSLQITADSTDLADVTFFVVAVPTPIDAHRQPNLKPLISATETIAKVIQPGTVVVYESTVYPGLTEEICGATLSRISGLEQGVDFKLGYSPERINPGDREHSLERVVKVVAAEDEETLERVDRVYRRIVPAGTHRATSIKVAEMAKVIENTQRDLNIALMNELSLICDRLGIASRDVLAAAGTKWNFLNFTPGLVGGHCIGVDPYYLTSKAESLGYHPQVILAGRRINDSMGTYLGQRLVKLLVQSRAVTSGWRIGILGLTFKENVTDIRNSRVPDIVAELREFGIDPLVHDPLADAEMAMQEYGIQLVDWAGLANLDGLVIAVAHQQFRQLPPEKLFACLDRKGVIMDVKSMLNAAMIPAEITYWSL